MWNSYLFTFVIFISRKCNDTTFCACLKFSTWLMLCMLSILKFWLLFCLICRHKALWMWCMWRPMFKQYCIEGALCSPRWSPALYLWHMCSIIPSDQLLSAPSPNTFWWTALPMFSVPTYILTGRISKITYEKAHRCHFLVLIVHFLLLQVLFFMCDAGKLSTCGTRRAIVVSDH